MTTAILSVFAIALAVWLAHASAEWRTASAVDRYETAIVTQGNVITTVQANGTLNPVAVVTVGTQVSGTIGMLYADFNDRIEAGKLLAEIDPAVYQAAVDQTRASFESARMALELSRRKESRFEDLFKQDLIDRQSLEEIVQSRLVAAAHFGELKAQLSRDLSNLGYTKIYAPVSGIVLSREVTVGQTVAASFQTPTLFKIAQDLQKMQIECHVPEADIGVLRPGQRVTFTVDAFPEKKFAGSLRQIRFDPKVSENIVTYSVMIDVVNSGGELMPGMTALITITTAERNNVLRVPNAALAFKPDAAPNTAPAGTSGGATLYVLSGSQLRAVPIRTGLSDSEYTEVAGAGLRRGAVVVVAERPAKAASVTAG